MSWKVRVASVPTIEHQPYAELSSQELFPTGHAHEHFLAARMIGEKLGDIVHLAGDDDPGVGGTGVLLHLGECNRAERRCHAGRSEGIRGQEPQCQQVSKTGYKKERKAQASPLLQQSLSRRAFKGARS